MKYILVESDFFYGHKVLSPFYDEYGKAVDESIAILEASFPTDHLKINEIRKDFMDGESTIVNDNEYYILDVNNIFTEYHPEFEYGCENYFAVCTIDNGEIQKPQTPLCFAIEDAVEAFQEYCSEIISHQKMTQQCDGNIDEQLLNSWVTNFDGREYHLVHIVREMC